MPRRRTIALFVLAASLVAASLPTFAADEDAVWDLIDMSGVVTFFQAIPADLKRGLSDMDASEVQIQIMLKLVDSFFDVNGAVTDVADALVEALTDGDVAELAAWYASDLGARILAAEIDTLSPDWPDEGLSYAAPLMSDLDRYMAAHAIHALHGGTAHVSASFEVFSTAGMLLAAIATYGALESSLDAVSAELEKARPMMVASLNQAEILGRVAAYRDFTVDEQQAYIRFLETPAARKFREIVQKASIDASARFVATLETRAASLFNSVN